jgi:hypothetical protein
MPTSMTKLSTRARERVGQSQHNYLTVKDELLHRQSLNYARFFTARHTAFQMGHQPGTGCSRRSGTTPGTHPICSFSPDLLRFPILADQR